MFVGRMWMGHVYILGTYMNICIPHIYEPEIPRFIYNLVISLGLPRRPAALADERAGGRDPTVSGSTGTESSRSVESR